MRVSWKLGRIAGIDLFLHPSALLVLFVAAGITGGDIVSVFPLVAAVFGSIVLHELGHALMARWYGIGTHDITLYMIGGVARLKRMPRSAGPEILIALAGPAVNVAIASGLAGVIGLSRVLGLPWDFWLELLSINVGLCLFNLLPVFPMDGGRVFRALLSSWLGRARATTIAAGIGQFLAVTGGVVGVVSGRWDLAILAIFIYLAAGTERASLMAEARGRDPRSQGFTNAPEAPAGFRWADRGDGIWRLVPLFGRVRTWGSN